MFARIVCLLFLIPAYIFAQTTQTNNEATAADTAIVQADEEFRWGVQSFHAGQYNEALISFTRTLAFNLNHPYVHYWLANTYYASGYLDAAIEEWTRIFDKSGDSYIAELKQSVISQYFTPAAENMSFVEVSSYSLTGNSSLIQNATNVQARRGGGFYLLSIKQNEIVQVSTTGTVTGYIRGGANNLRTPFDMLEYKGNLYVSEFNANFIAKLNADGNRIGGFGSKGIGDGQFLGPQYLAVDKYGSLYISDWGNKRLHKFSEAGDFMLSFPVLKKPMGVAVVDAEVFVADADLKQILVFDTDGNLIRRSRVLLNSPESLRVYDSSHLLISDGSRLLLYNIDDDSVIDSIAEGSVQKIIAATRDETGSIIAIDIERNSLHFFVKSHEAYSGLNVNIERVRSNDFPRITIDVQVSNSMGEPISGLLDSDFVVSEQNRIVNPLRIIRDGQRNASLDTVLLLERSSEAQRYQQAAIDAVQGLWRNNKGMRVTVISAEDQPVKIIEELQSPAIINENAYFSELWQFDNSLYYAASELVRSGAYRSIVFVSTGPLPATAFTNYSPENLAYYMKVNNISFSIIYLNPVLQPDAFLQYLVSETDGTTAFVYEENSIDELADYLYARPSGYYVLEYISEADPDFGRSYIPETVEVQLFIRSGRAESGFYAPLNFEP